MPLELKEFSDITAAEVRGDGPRPPTEEELTRALQVLMVRQCVYSSTPGVGRTYDIVREHAPFFERYFGALGYGLIISHRDQMVALSVPDVTSRYDAIYERLRKDETLVLLMLKLIFEEGLREHRVADGGIVETSTNEIVDKFEATAGERPPEEGRMIDILRFFQRKGVVRIGQRDRIEHITPVSVLPGIDVVVPESYVEQLKLWATSASADTADAQDAAAEV